jgi:hypothetical protein
MAIIAATYVATERGVAATGTAGAANRVASYQLPDTGPPAPGPTDPNAPAY